MKFFKKPGAAIFLSLLVVYLSTTISINAKLTDKCLDISDGFFVGVRVDGVDYPPVYDSVKELCSISDEMIIIAKNYGIDTEDLYYAQDWLESAMVYSPQAGGKPAAEHRPQSKAYRSHGRILSSDKLCHRSCGGKQRRL